MWEQISGCLNEFGQCLSAAGQSWFTPENITLVLENRWTRAAGMVLLVWMTIWVIALVYSGYMQDFEKGPIGLRPHVNKKQGEKTIVFDKDVVPYQMDGVDAKCRFFFIYDNAQGKRRRVALGGVKEFQLHIRPTPVPRAATLVQYGYEVSAGLADVPSELVAFPTFEPGAPPPETVGATPATVGEYVKANDLERKWTEDDDAPIVSISQTELDLITDERRTFIRGKAQKLADAARGGVFRSFERRGLARERPNVFGSYYVKLQFSQNPIFVLFKHPNRELKMTAWLTVLTSLFALAMDLWPVRDHQLASAASGDRSRAVVQQAPVARRP
ncbi:MAG: hypothetical protein AB7J28_16475 [Hyphomonadaceae bacterium]